MLLNLADARLSVEGYRIQVIEKLKAMQDPAAACALMAEVDTVLQATGFSRPAQRAFWQALDTDLDVIGEEWAEMLGKDAAAALGPVIATAKTALQRYLELASASS